MKHTERMEGFDLTEYMSEGIKSLVSGAMRASLRNPRQSAFLLRYAKASRAAARKRKRAEARGEHIPPFLIASITSSCNLHCAGCYARHNHACFDAEVPGQLADEEWLEIFTEARELGVSFILLAGGEPLLRRGVVRAAGMLPEILFPVFTNGTVIDDTYLRLFDECRNVLPILSIEGGEEKTDERRGAGVYTMLSTAMERMRERQLFFGASITVTTENLDEVTSREFLDGLQASGCKVVFYVEYVPVSEGSQSLALGDEERERLAQRVLSCRTAYDGMLFVSFPGDEHSSGGCLAAGRGFFHINATGGAEPCPFSPYSDINVRDTSLREALRSPLFRMLKEEHIVSEEHVGGCVLFEKRDRVEAIAKRG